MFRTFEAAKDFDVMFKRFLTVSHVDERRSS